MGLPQAVCCFRWSILVCTSCWRTYVLHRALDAEISLETKGFLFAILMYGLFSAVSVQKSVRDRLEGIPVTSIYYGLSWFSILLCLVLMSVGLWNAKLTLAERGFYCMAYLLSLFAAITVQKNTRDSVSTAQAPDYNTSVESEFVPSVRT